MSDIILEHTFENDLRLVYQQRKNSSISSINIFVGVGSNYEELNINNGMSHFLEHMLFKGTKKYKTAKDISMLFDSYGCYINAYTDKECTSYIIKCESEYLDKCYPVLADLILNTVFNKEEFEKERHVVVEELKRVDDNPTARIIDESYKLMFKDNPIGLSTGGTQEQVLNFKLEDVVNFYKKYYITSNIVVSVCSNYDFDTIKRMIKYSVLGKAKSVKNTKSSLKVAKIIQNKPIEEFKDLKVIHKDLEQTHITIGFRTVDIYSDETYPLDIINAILTGSMSSLLFINLREKYGLTYNVDIEQTQYKLGGAFIILTSVDKDRLLNSNAGKGAIPVIIDTLNKLKRDGIDLNDFKKIKGYMNGTLSLDYDDSLSISDSNGIQAINNISPIITLKTLLKIYDKITRKDINYIINKYINKSLMSVVLMGDDIKKDEAIHELNKLD